MANGDRMGRLASVGVSPGGVLRQRRGQVALPEKTPSPAGTALSPAAQRLMELLIQQGATPEFARQRAADLQGTGGLPPISSLATPGREPTPIMSPIVDLGPPGQAEPPIERIKRLVREREGLSPGAPISVLTGREGEPARDEEPAGEATRALAAAAPQADDTAGLIEALGEDGGGDQRRQRLGELRGQEGLLTALQGVGRGLQQAGRFRTVGQMLRGDPGFDFGGGVTTGPQLEQLQARRQQLEAELDQPTFDPRSQVSKRAQEIVARTLRLDAKDLENSSAADLQALFGPIGGLAQREQEGIRQRETQIELLGARERERLRKEARLTPKQVEDITAIEQSIANMGDILQQKTAENFDTGPLINLLESAANVVGIETQDLAKKNAFRAAIVDAAAQYRKAISGANVSQFEIRQLARFQPSMRDQDRTFISKAQNLIRIMRKRRTVLLNALKKGGKDVSAFRQSARETTPSVLVRFKGRDFQVPIDKAHRFMDVEGVEFPNFQEVE